MRTREIRTGKVICEDVQNYAGESMVTAVISTDGTLTTPSDAEVPSTQAVVDYVAAAVSDITPTEADFLDGATAGTQVASKVVVADANVNIGETKVTTLHIGATGAETEVTATGDELNVLAGVTAGTQAAGQAVVADANVNTGVSKVTELHIGATGAETQVTASAAEINAAADVSAQLETIDSGVAVSNALPATDIDNTVTGAGAVTLAAPSAAMKGKIKTITMTVDGGDVTMALTEVNNVAGASAGTTCTFDAVGDCIILAATGAKWTVIGISGAAIT